MERKVFYSFHYDNDVFRVQQIRNMGMLDGNRPVSFNKWEDIKRGGDAAIKSWINENMQNKSCLVVLVGEETASRKWVRYEIKRAWNEGKGVLAIHIHHLNCMQNGYCAKGENPFHRFSVGDKLLSSIVECYNPKADAAYRVIKANIQDWIEEAIEIRNKN